MLTTLKQSYWRIRETLPGVLHRLQADPPLKRLDRILRTRFRHTLWIAGIGIRLAPGMGSAAVAYILDGRYEKPERRILEYALKPGDRVLELGTGVGYLSAFCARRIGSENVITFEANPLLRPLIEETYLINNVSPRVEFCMLGEREGSRSFYVSREFWSSSAISRKKRTEQQITVPVKAFNEVLHDFKPNFLVIDIEGGEADLVRFMALDGVTKICIELHPWTIGKEADQAVRNFFASRGFREIHSVSDEEHILFERI